MSACPTRVDPSIVFSSFLLLCGFAPWRLCVRFFSRCRFQDAGYFSLNSRTPAAITRIPHRQSKARILAAPTAVLRGPRRSECPCPANAAWEAPRGTCDSEVRNPGFLQRQTPDVLHLRKLCRLGVAHLRVIVEAEHCGVGQLGRESEHLRGGFGPTVPFDLARAVHDGRLASPTSRASQTGPQYCLVTSQSNFFSCSIAACSRVRLFARHRPQPSTAAATTNSVSRPRRL